MIDFLDEQGRVKDQVLKRLAKKGALQRSLNGATAIGRSDRIYEAYAKTGWAGVLELLVLALRHGKRRSDRERDQIAKAILEVMAFAMGRFRLGKCKYMDANPYEWSETGWVKAKNPTAGVVPHDAFAHLYISRDAGKRATWCPAHANAAKQWTYRLREKQRKQSRTYMPSAQLPRGV